MGAETAGRSRSRGLAEITVRRVLLTTHKTSKAKPPRRVPYGVTLIGKLFDEGMLGRVGVALERAFNVASERPKGFE